MVARIDTWKGQDLLLRAFARAFPSGSTRLVLAGSADFGHDAYLESLRSLAAQLDIASRVDFLGHVTDVPSLIASWDLCVQSSIRPEPLGQNVLQYLAAGKPAIVTDQGGPSEWVRDGWNGWTFEMGSVDALSDALTAARDPKLRRHVAANAARTPNLLTDRQVTDAHGDVFEAVHRAATRRTER
ncbi:glycosyltransferase [Microbacterium sp. BDGP8]|uniref:glycosyltransferase n=1 Tax=Microbacterium sp. BDGP8 TaxID=3035531 RepID=UPI00249E010F|nr:glycosyltransferase [Microbacterium sp. BDGP8]WHE35753.1 glycosyltransferase [Microbacterium sp. BDGP8]